MTQEQFIPRKFEWYQVAGTEGAGGETGTTYAMRVGNGYVLKTLDWDSKPTEGGKDGGRQGINAMGAALTFVPHPALGGTTEYPPAAEPEAIRQK